MIRALISSTVLFTSFTLVAAEPRIDRHALVTRHNITLKEFDVNNPLSLGNGEFCFTVDVTGLQTFLPAFEQTIPLGTMADWSWHTIPTTNDWNVDTFHFKEFPDLHGRMVPYCDVPANNQTPEIKWLRSNPHRLHLGQVGLRLLRADGSLAATNDLSRFHQTLDLWNGILTSQFQFEGEMVTVETVCDPRVDGIAVRVQSSLVAKQRLAIQIHFPYGTGDTITADWSKPDAHETKVSQPKANRADFWRKLDNDKYSMAASWSRGATLTNLAKHQFAVVPSAKADALEFSFVFNPSSARPAAPATFAQAKRAAQKHWNKFWSTGGAIDLSGSADPRWFELERRIVLSEYITAIQSTGKNPPQETGLIYNTWMGKFHLEMHWWHEAHFALWNRLPLLENSLDYYQNILSRAIGTAKRQGYAGARWPKMTNPNGAESPSPVGPFLVWQQPHPIFYAELCWRQHQDRATLEKFKDVVFQTADFMASYATWDENTRRYVLGPILQCAQEIFPKDKTLNPTFELTYWRWGLETAQEWRARLGLPRNAEWDKVLRGLARPLVVDGKYAFTESTPDSYTNSKWNADHPSVTAALGILPGNDLDAGTMRATLDWIMANWNWPDTWGWDYPMLAMTAARLGKPEVAIDALFVESPKNHYAINGHVYQRPGLTIYLPANGGLLYAVGMMAGGWDGAPDQKAPGFPKNWKVRYENLRAAP